MKNSVPTESIEPMCRMVYISKACIPSKSDLQKVLSSILYQSNKNNKTTKVSGALCYYKEYFFQYVEGSKDELLTLISKLESDDRHCNFYMLDFSTIPRRRFVTWQMRCYGLEYLIKKSKNFHQFSSLEDFDCMKKNDIIWRNFIEELVYLESIENNKKYPTTILYLLLILFISTVLIFFYFYMP